MSMNIEQRDIDHIAENLFSEAEAKAKAAAEKKAMDNTYSKISSMVKPLYEENILFSFHIV